MTFLMTVGAYNLGALLTSLLALALAIALFLGYQKQHQRMIIAGRASLFAATCLLYLILLSDDHVFEDTTLPQLIEKHMTDAARARHGASHEYIRENPMAELRYAHSVILPNSMESKCNGTVSMHQLEGQPTVFKVVLSGLSPGPHGFHVHSVGDLFGNAGNGQSAAASICAAAGGHYNPFGKKLGSAEDVSHLGNLMANASGMVEVTLENRLTLLYDPKNATTEQSAPEFAASILNRSFVIHSSAMVTSGNPDGRVCCGTIKRSVALIEGMD